MGTVYTMDHDSLIHQIADLVCLQMTDHMPPDIIGELWKLVIDLLNAVFAKGPLTGIVGLPEIVHGHGLGDTDERDIISLSARPLTGFLYTVFHTAYIFSYHTGSFKNSFLSIIVKAADSACEAIIIH